MKKTLLVLTLALTVLTVAGCAKKEEKEYKKEALAFKEDYESLNGKKNKMGKEHRKLNINKENPFVTTTAEEIVKKIENNETFYVYFGDKLCPWCRSVIEKSIEVANNNKITTIYYVPIWDDEGNEILRDKYELDSKNKAVKKVDGTQAYYKLLKYFDSVLSEYKLKTEDGKEISTKEKRIYAPNFVYVKDGKAIKLTEGISDKQKDSREKLTDEILKDEEKMFTEFFKN